MSGALDGAAVFLTGGSRGIGLAIAEKLAAEHGARSRCSPRPPSRTRSCPARCTPRPRRSRPPAARRCRSRATCATPRPSQAGGGAGRRGVRRHRHLHQQRERDRPARRRGAAGQELRPAAVGQRARHVRRDAGLPAPPARVGHRPRADAVAAAEHRRALVPPRGATRSASTG